MIPKTIAVIYNPLLGPEGLRCRQFGGGVGPPVCARGSPDTPSLLGSLPEVVLSSFIIIILPLFTNSLIILL